MSRLNRVDGKKAPLIVDSYSGIKTDANSAFDAIPAIIIIIATTNESGWEDPVWKNQSNEMRNQAQRSSKN